MSRKVLTVKERSQRYAAREYRKPGTMSHTCTAARELAFRAGWRAALERSKASREKFPQ